MGLDRPGRRPDAVAPHAAQQLFAREHMVRLGRELDEKGELLLREMHLSPARDHAARRTVDYELAEVQALAARRATAQHRTDSRDELLVREGPREVVVGPFE